MAIYHLSIKIITRGKGKSAVAAAAYRAGETIKNEYDGVTHDYTRKGGIVHTEILLPDHAPAEYADRAALWNAVEMSERYCTAQLSREIEIALPVELTIEQNISLARKYVKDNFVNAGMCADICVHDGDGKNPHTHIMLTMRPIEPNGKWGQKSHTVDGRKINTVDWNDRDKAEHWREAWAAYCNDALRENGHDTNAVLDHRSYERQGIEQVPTIHLGTGAHQLEQRGIRTERGDRNREIAITNREIRMLRARIIKLEKWIAEETTNATPPTLANVISDILSRQDKSTISRIKYASQMLLFLQQNKINDIAGLEDKVKSMYAKTQSLREKLKPVERRIKTLEEHIKHSDNFKQFRKIKSQYTELYSQYEAARKATGFGAERKAQKALDAANEFYENHRSELFQFDTAETYLRGVLQERFDPKKPPPISKWREELSAKTAERDSLYREYNSLKSETQKVEQIKRSVTDILREGEAERQPQKSQGVEL